MVLRGILILWTNLGIKDTAIMTNKTGLIAVSCRPDQGRWIEVYQCLEDLIKPEGWKIKYFTSWFSYQNKNFAVDYAKARNLDYIFFVDDDQILPPDTLIRLLAHDKDVVTCNLISRVPPFHPFLFMDAKDSGEAVCLPLDEQKGLIEVEACGAGGILIKAECFNKVKWGVDELIKTEDLFICRELRKNNYKIYCDLSAPSGHIAVAVVWPDKVNGKWVTTIVHNNDLKIQLPAAKNVNGLLTIPDRT